MALEGACLCGAVRYRVTDDPLTFYACHCTDCQKQSGSAFGLSMIVAREAFEIVQGDPEVLALPMADGRTKRPGVCRVCRTRLFALSKVPEVMVIRPGTLVDTSALRPIGHIWTRSAQPWMEIPEGPLSYPGQPDDMLELIRAWRSRPEAGAQA